ncbi:oligoendopeptidase F [Frisingicoccus sp.]|uniref:oligoendopeptidase F n=1 Tax=Frisingicoccus sp. TaxID=1918627 RepID=UPI002E75CC3D|nr:oligoendopeptidase F [Frisingicoccus sp.]MEE0752173.1 oligoendopeptidase F [Frisingicoccus sp.]
MPTSTSLPKRSEINIENTWDLSPLCPDDEAFKAAFKEAESQIRRLPSWRGKIHTSPSDLLDYLREKDLQALTIDRLYSYAFQSSDQDTGNTAAQSLKNQCLGLYTRFASAISWEAPELLTLTEETLNRWFSEETALENYRHFLEDTLRQKAHTLSAEEEALLSLSGDMSYGPQTIFNMFNNADLRFPSIDDGSGGQVEITHGRFISLMENKNRQVRKDAFTGLYRTYAAFKNTLAAAYSANVKKELFYTKARKYASTMEAHLDTHNIPTAVYTQLIDTVHAFLPAMYRYVALRKKLLGVEELHMYDVYTPIADDNSPEIPFDKAKQMVLEGLAPLGQDYLDKLQEGFDHRWIDVYENQGKRSGAYSTCVYGAHPYVLLNYQGNLDNVFTLAHEMGHSLHSCYTNESQTYINSEYNIFVAEIASTCNEYLLIHDLLKKAGSREEKAYLLNHLLDMFKGTLFRQTMFAEFEKITHEKEAAGEPLTCDVLCDVYLDLNRLYFGPEMVVDDEIAMEWARIPHFYTPFYVYQYATGISAAIAFGSRILNEEPEALENYKRFLRGGCAMDCMDLLKSCGVDMTSPQPTTAALKVFEDILGQLEDICL